jgi:dehydrogenase/reductase SDR family protein 12
MFLAYGLRKFTKGGFENARKSFKPEDTAVDLKGKHILITGGNQGIGYAAAIDLAKLGASIHVVCRNAERGRESIQKIKDETGNVNVFLHVCDVSSLNDIKRLANEYRSSGHPLHVLVNNAGVMVPPTKSVDGYEINFATNTLGSFAVTRAFEPILKSSGSSKVIFVSSGGALTESLVVDDLEGNSLKKDSNFGQSQYARDKRRQIVIAEELAQEYASSNIFACSMHPGWCDTSGVVNSMPSFHARFKSSLRSPAEGADTVVWLATKNVTDLETGAFYLDRSVQSKHLPLAGTGYSKEEARALVTKLDEMIKGRVV